MISITLFKSFINVRENRLRMDNPETMDEDKQSIKKNKKKTKKNKTTTIKKPKYNEHYFS